MANQKVQPLTSEEIRNSFLDFFKGKNHVQLPAWPLIPVGDPTTLFTTAGMQQFKPYFTGLEVPEHKRVTTIQPCFRTPDIEEVGDLSHLTAFEMMGNFSFGDYFKSEIITWAYELLTKIYRIPNQNLHFSIFSEDEEAYDAWRSLGIEDAQIHRYGQDENYWFSGPTGRCGPDSEIFFDFTPDKGPENTDPAKQSDRFLEIWNLVFMQNLRDENGSFSELPKKNIDTGSGLERIAAVLQGKKSVFETDIFLPILKEASEILGNEHMEGTTSATTDYAIRAMSEHSRAATLLTGDGVVPSNEGRGYVLRRIIRRAIYLARREGLNEPFLPRLAEISINKLSPTYPHLNENLEFIMQAIGSEEDRFSRTLSAASQRLDRLINREQAAGSSNLSGEIAFELYDTYGLPLELTSEIAKTQGIQVDALGFQTALEDQRKRARQAAHFSDSETLPALSSLTQEHSTFTGYTHLEEDAEIATILKNGENSGPVTAGEDCEIILSTTPFYPEGGGQIGDRGIISSPQGVLEIKDTQQAGNAIVHQAHVIKGEISSGSSVVATVDQTHRFAAASNHTATHLLHSALRDVLGSHVRQQGSLVSAERFRFDFTHLEKIPEAALAEVQQLVNSKVRDNLEVAWRNSSYQEAVSEGALAFFGDKYGAEVRVVEIGPPGESFSMELCGGTHVDFTGRLGFVQILRETSVAAGSRRLEALSGFSAENYFSEQIKTLQNIANALSTTPAESEKRIHILLEELTDLREQTKKFERARASTQTEELKKSAEKIGETFIINAVVQDTDQAGLKVIADQLRSDLKQTVVLLATVRNGQVSFLCTVSHELVEQGLNAGDIVRSVAKIAGGGGGGRPELAEAGGGDASQLTNALKHGKDLITETLNK